MFWLKVSAPWINYTTAFPEYVSSKNSKQLTSTNSKGSCGSHSAFSSSGSDSSPHEASLDMVWCGLAGRGRPLHHPCDPSGDPPQLKVWPWAGTHCPGCDTSRGAINHVTTASLSSGVSKLSVQGWRGKIPGTAGHLASVPPAHVGPWKSGSSHRTIHSRAVSQENFLRDAEIWISCKFHMSGKRIPFLIISPLLKKKM